MNLCGFEVGLDNPFFLIACPCVIESMQLQLDTAGKLNEIDIDPTGVVYARYSNGDDQALGQVALGTFTNPQGLQPQGNNVWAETYASGDPRIGAPDTADFGVLQSGALEASTVDLTEQLVNMITAQRNFQANAQMISTQDQVTQTIINIR